MAIGIFLVVMPLRDRAAMYYMKVFGTATQPLVATSRSKVSNPQHSALQDSYIHPQAWYSGVRHVDYI